LQVDARSLLLVVFLLKDWLPEMIVFNLSCSQTHSFDGWFRSSADFDSQSRMGLVECPICGDANITKQLSAPRINVGAASGTASAVSDTTSIPGIGGTQPVPAATMIPGLQQHMLAQFRKYVVAHTENVGNRFAETARRMHYGEEAHRGIRGHVSPHDAQALHDEGIDTVSLPPGVMLDEGLQ
jgi:hypothetical protein